MILRDKVYKNEGVIENREGTYSSKPTSNHSGCDGSQPLQYGKVSPVDKPPEGTLDHNRTNFLFEEPLSGNCSARGRLNRS